MDFAVVIAHVAGVPVEELVGLLSGAGLWTGLRLFAARAGTRRSAG